MDNIIKNKKVFTVYEVNHYIKSLFNDDVIVSALFVQGEITNFKKHSQGHLYFSLKDDNALINCIMFKSETEDLIFAPSNGINVIALGYISVYEKTGGYQLYVSTLRPISIGNVKTAFDKLKERLQKEGLFDNKLPIPKTIGTVAVITSKTGSVIRDIISVIKRRNPSIEILIAPTLVQGRDAADEIIRSFNLVTAYAKASGKVDVILLARGGGSSEDLGAFNDEAVARTICNSDIPVISAVGHETDFTISDFVADLRAETPSAAAEIISEDKSNLIELVQSKTNTLTRLMNAKIQADNQRLALLLRHSFFSKSLETIYKNQIFLDELTFKLLKETINQITKNKKELLNQMNVLEKVSPLNILKKGFSLTYRKDKIVRNVETLEKYDDIIIELENGTLTAVVIEISKKE